MQYIVEVYSSEDAQVSGSMDIEGSAVFNTVGQADAHHRKYQKTYWVTRMTSDEEDDDRQYDFETSPNDSSTWI